uniref:PUB domain-containing protein n=2 Tax=Chrysotila carterae TaxID=13221 RepID=A0A7S4C5G1_CHRCT
MMQEEEHALQAALQASRQEAAQAQSRAATSAAAAAAEARLARHAQRSVGTRAPTSAAAARTSTAAAAPAGPRVLGNAAAGSAEQRVQACAARLVGRPLAVDTLITSLSKVLDHPHEEKYRKVNISNKAFQERVASAPGGIDFMYAVGFEPVHGHLLLQSRDPALLWIGKSALEQQRLTGTYQRAKEALELEQALSMSQGAYESEVSKRRAASLARVPEEPAEGLAGNSLICVHVGDSQVWRRFESCNTLEDILHFARSIPGAPLGKATMHNITLNPAVDLDLERELGLTLQRLELWPTGHVRIDSA